MEPDWILERVDVSDLFGPYELLLEGRNLNFQPHEPGHRFYWHVDARRAISEPRYTWVGAVVTDAAQERIDRAGAALAKGWAP